MAFTVFCSAFFAVFTGLHLALMTGLLAEWLRDRAALKSSADKAEGRALFVSVVVPFRNEERRMDGLLASLACQDYPHWECVFIDDRSADRTADKLRAFAGAGCTAELTVITLTENPGVNAKQFALERGIAAARGELILFTDADCELRPGWIRAMASRMQDARTAAAIGPVFKKPMTGQKGAARSFFSLYQCFDHAVRYLYLAASTGLGAAGGGFGNNLILRRSALEAAGGYGAVPPSPTEDAALVSMLRCLPGSRVRAICALDGGGADAAVLTAPEASWKAFAAQTLRWNNGGLFSPDPATRLNFTFLMLMISIGMLCLPLLPFLPGLWPLPLTVFLSMSINTAAVLALFGGALPRAGAAWALQTVFTPMYFTFLTILGLLGFKPSWKNSDIEEGKK